MLAAPYLASHQSGGFQHADVARNACERHWEGRGQVGDAGVALTQCRQQPSSSGVGKGAIRTVENLIFNHSVDYNGRS